MVMTVIWLLTAATLFLPGDSLLLQAGRLTFAVTAAAHVVECGIFLSTLRASSRSLGENLVQTMLFGVLHYATLKLEEPDTTL